MSEHWYKFTLHERLQKLPHEEFELAWNFLPVQLGIAKGTFKNWVYRPADSSDEIPAAAILKLAGFFQCEPGEIFSKPFSPEALQVDWEKEKEKATELKQMKFNFTKAIEK